MDAGGIKPEILWQSAKAGQTSMDDYRRHVNERFRTELRSTVELQRWTVDHAQEFWIDLYSWLELKPELPAGLRKAYDDTVPMSSIPRWFDGLELNYAENALFSNPDPNAIALVGIHEGMDWVNDEADTLTWHEFREMVRRTVSALRRSGVKKGDRVAALVANSIWAIVLYHASASMAAIFTSISPDLGLEGCVSRLRQVTPTILIADGDTLYKGKITPTPSKIRQILDRLESKPQTYIIPISSQQTTFPTMDDFLAKADPRDALTFERVPFNYPLVIVYSSGTTGPPKCIVHQHGLIIQLKKISIVHNSTTPADVVLQYSSTSWVVFNVMCGYFACGAKTIVYNGSPMYPDTLLLMRMIEKFRVTYFGTSPRYLLEVEMSRSIPREVFDLESMRIVYTTGATLSPEQYKWFYRNLPAHVHLCNTAGGTDTCTSLIAADPAGPLHAGEMQIFALGMDVDIADPVSGESIMHTGEAGEMIVRKPFPSMPCFFWGDAGNKKYHESYFERFDNIDVWAQHDWLLRKQDTGGLVMQGRSDGVLSKPIHSILENIVDLFANTITVADPSGIRFGSGEIYAIVESKQFNHAISNTLCVGRRRPQDTDEAVFLFIVMNRGHNFNSKLRNEIKQAIRDGLSSRHVPKFVLEVPELPVTINGKKIETAVKQIISGKKVTPSATVSNPDAFALFTRFVDIETEPRDAKL